MFGLKPTELLIILAIVLLLFGARKLPDLARSLGASAKEFRKGIEAGRAGYAGMCVLLRNSGDSPP